MYIIRHAFISLLVFKKQKLMSQVTTCLCTHSLPTSSLPGRGCFVSWEEYCPGSKALLDFSRIRPDVACWLLPEKSQEPSWMPKESLSQQLWVSTSTPLTTFPPQDFCHQFIAQWKQLNLDVMLCPMLGPALGIGYPAKLSGRALPFAVALCQCP